MSGGTTAHDTSRSWADNGIGFRADPWASRTISLWQPGGQLFGISSRGRLQWGASTAGTHQQTRELAGALSIGGGGASDGAQRPGVATKVFPLSAAARTKDRQGGDGAPAGGSPLLDVAQGMGLRAVEQIRSARGPARNRRWCAVKHRVNRLVQPAPQRGSSNWQS